MYNFAFSLILFDILFFVLIALIFLIFFPDSYILQATSQPFQNKPSLLEQTQTHILTNKMNNMRLLYTLRKMLQHSWEPYTINPHGVHMRH